MLIFINTSAIFLLAGFLQGLTGFGAGLIAMPLLCLFLDVKTAVPLCVLNSIIITTYLLFKLNNHIHLRKVLPLCLSALPGIYIGTTFLRSIDSSIISNALGVLLIGYCLFTLTATPEPRPLKTFWGYIAGFFSGTIGSAFGAGGPPAIIYTTLNDWSKNDIKATLTAFFAFNSYITAIVHAGTGVTTSAVLKHFAVSSPSVLIGTIFGSMLYNRLPRHAFIKLVFLLLLLMGITLLLSH